MPLAMLILELLEQGIEVMPSLASAAKLDLNLFMSGTPPTAAEQAQIDQAREAANTALQAA